ncbi:MAG: DUF4199 domain-containing protein [Hyphomonadaceae bacterium]|mgnify:CR=1 FL=1|nr:DUF4199 domain-containing protein [Hyphomonadaceae bacterium]
MFRPILTYGVIAGVIVVAPMMAGFLFGPPPEETLANGAGMLIGYLSMLVALSVIFVAVKRYRDKRLGGVIKFLPAFLLGLGISAVAGVIYVIGWEITLSLMNYEFMETYTRVMIEAKQREGLAGPELEAYIAQMQQMTAQYRNPLFRLPITFLEIFPVGLLVSLITALILRNSRILPARPAPAA